jgi:hypothetical protein
MMIERRRDEKMLQQKWFCRESKQNRQDIKANVESASKRQRHSARALGSVKAGI